MFLVVIFLTAIQCLTKSKKYQFFYKQSGKILSYDDKKFTLQPHLSQKSFFKVVQSDFSKTGTTTHKSFLIETNLGYICNVSAKLKICRKRKAQKHPWNIMQGNSGLYEISTLFDKKNKQILAVIVKDNEVRLDLVHGEHPNDETSLWNLVEAEKNENNSYLSGKLRKKRNKRSQNKKSVGSISTNSKIKHPSTEEESEVEHLTVKNTLNSKVIAEKFPSGTIIYEKTPLPDRSVEVETKKIILPNQNNQTNDSVLRKESWKNGSKHSLYVVQ